MSVKTATVEKDLGKTGGSAAPGSGVRFGVGKIIDRWLLAEIVPQVLLYLLIVGGMFILFTATVVMKYLTSGVPAWIVLEVLGLNLPPYIVIAFPMAVLLGNILAFTKISGDSEAVALLAAGVSFRRMLRPVAIVGLALAIIGLVINNTVVPYANKRLADLKEHALKENVTSTGSSALPPLRTKTAGKDGALQALFWCEGGYDATSQSMRKVYIFEMDPKTGGVQATFYALSAHWNGGQSWDLRSVVITSSSGIKSYFKHLTTREITLEPDTVAFLDRNPDTLSFSELNRQINLLKATGSAPSSSIRQAEVSLWNKISLPIAGFIFAFVGAALGFRPQRSASRGMAIGQGVLIIFLYYSMYKWMETAGSSGQMEPMLAAFLPLILSAVAAWILESLATT